MLAERFLHRCGNEEVLLFQPQFLAGIVVVVRIQNFRDRAGKIILLNGLVILAPVERCELKPVDRLRIPDPQRINHSVVKTDDRNVIGHCEHRTVIFVYEFVFMSCRIILDTGIAAKAYFLRMLLALQLKRIYMLKPCIRHFLLESVLNLLLEHAIMIADAAAICVVSQ